MKSAKHVIISTYTNDISYDLVTTGRLPHVKPPRNIYRYKQSSDSKIKLKVRSNALSYATLLRMRSTSTRRYVKSTRRYEVTIVSSVRGSLVIVSEVNWISQIIVYLGMKTYCVVAQHVSLHCLLYNKLVCLFV